MAEDANSVEQGSGAGTDLAERDPWDAPEGATGLALIEPTPELVEVAKRSIIDKEPPPEIGDPNITARLILERIAAGTLEDSMSPADSLPAWGEAYRDVPVVVRGFHFNPSTIEVAEGPNKGKKGVYAVVELMTVEDAEIVTVQVGSDTVCMQLVKAWEEGAFPFTAVLTARSTGQAGREVYYLEKPGA